MVKGMRMEMIATPIIVMFLCVAVFGMYATLSHDAHERGCPLMMAEAAICDVSFAGHLSLWQSLFASILGSLTVLLAFAIFKRLDAVLLHEYALFRVHVRTPRRPTFLQELFSQGVLHSKAF
ncbi:MAG: hypothetical protein AAB605_00025 [Patescibacteria group bacterium]